MIYTVPDTELTYTDPDKVALEYYMGGLSENLKEWAQRIWKNYPHHDKPGSTSLDVPLEDRAGALWLWETKKKNRRSKLTEELLGHKNPMQDHEIVSLKSHKHYQKRSDKDAKYLSKSNQK